MNIVYITYRYVYIRLYTSVDIKMKLLPKTSVVRKPGDSRRISLIAYFLKLIGGIGLKMSQRHLASSSWQLAYTECKQALDLVLVNQSTSNEDEILGVIQRLGEEHPDMPFIVFAGPISLDDRLHLLSLGAVDVITRPTHLSTIAQSILQAFYDNRTVSTPAFEEELIDESLDLDGNLDLME